MVMKLNPALSLKEQYGPKSQAWRKKRATVGGENFMIGSVFTLRQETKKTQMPNRFIERKVTTGPEFL